MTAIEAEPTLRSETVFSGRLIDVRKETVRLPNGKTTDREIVVHPEVIAVLPVLDDGRLVLVRQFRKAVERVLLEVPAGGIDDGETAEDAVKREMVEETGYRVGTLTHLVSFYTSPGFTTELMHLYEARDLEPGKPTEETDQIEVVVMTPEEALRQVRSGIAADAKTVLALMYGRDR
ncbi:MAG TPA: NUDIX hydrolase [Chloroflexota bacterium]